jgi:hypothetical protein
MIPVEVAIIRFRRDLAIGTLLRTLLVLVAVACLTAGPALGMHEQAMYLLLIVGGVWVMLSYRSMQGSRVSADSPSLIAAGEFDRAEAHIDSALRTFSLFRTNKLLSLHHLALLRHAQRRWRESALLCQALLSRNLGSRLRGLARTTWLLLADSRLQLGDLPAAYDAMAAIYRYRLTLGEALTFQLMQLDYGSRIGAWGPMLESVGAKVQMSELMPALSAARSQALMALAAYKLGREPLAQWLRRRAQLLADPCDISADFPLLEEMFAAAGPGNTA